MDSFFNFSYSGIDVLLCFVGEQLRDTDLLKELLDSFPWQQTVSTPLFSMLNWAILDGFHLSGNIADGIEKEKEKEFEAKEESFELKQDYTSDERIVTKSFEEEFYTKRIAKVIQLFPDTINEIDKKGQHFLSYVIRTNSVPLLEYFISINKHCVRFKDGTGKQAIHYIGKVFNMFFSQYSA